jgi:hypothetical protein
MLGRTYGFTRLPAIALAVAVLVACGFARAAPGRIAPAAAGEVRWDARAHARGGSQAGTALLAHRFGYGKRSSCGPNRTRWLNEYLNSFPAGSTVTLPSDACFTIDGVVTIDSTTGLTVDGNGATLEDPIAGVNGGTHASQCPTHPIVFLTRDTGLTLENLNLEGAYNGHNGGVYCAGYMGIKMEADTDTDLTGIDLQDVQGNGMDLDPPLGLGSGALSVNTSLTDSVFRNIGYVALVGESFDGWLVRDDQFMNTALDAIDLEYDTYSTGDHHDQPVYAAEDNLTVEDNLFRNWGADWFASLQGQTPGVQEQNIVLEDNTLQAARPLVQIRGTLNAPPFYANSGLVIEGNTGTQGAKSTSGGSPDEPYVGSTMTFQNVNNVTVSGNTLPVYDGSRGYYHNHPYLAVLEAQSSEDLTLKDNAFDGALGILHPRSSGDTDVTECGNTYGVKGTSNDGKCWN